MKKYTFMYKNKEYIENIYDNKSTTILSKLLPQLDEKDVEKLVNTVLNFKHVNEITYSPNLRTTKVGKNHNLNINFGRKVKIKVLNKIVLDQTIVDVFKITSNDLSSSEIKIWYPTNSEIIKQCKIWINEYNNENKDKEKEHFQKRVNSKNILNENYPLEKLNPYLTKNLGN